MIINDYVALYNSMTDEESERLRRMKYKEFLKTDYWRIVAARVRLRDKLCRHCESPDNLQVHHLTYENLGYEYRTYDSDLITLCGGCHKKVHGIDTLRLDHECKIERVKISGSNRRVANRPITHPERRKPFISRSQKRVVARVTLKSEIKRLKSELLAIDDEVHILSKRNRKTIGSGFSNIFACAETLGVKIEVKIVR